MSDKVVKAKVNVGLRRVVLTGEPGLPDRLTFKVCAGDTLRWDITDPLGDGARLRIRFVGFDPHPPQGPPTDTPAPVPLLVDGEEHTSTGASVLGGLVDEQSHEGRYFYKVFLVRAGQADAELECWWSDGTPAGMGGGDKSGKPPNG